MATLDIFSQFCEDLSTAAQSAGIVAGQITLGHWEQPSPTVDENGNPVVDNLWADVAKNGFYLFIESPKGHVNFYTRNGEFELLAKLIGSFPANESSNLQALQLQVAKLLDAWANFNQWNLGFNRESMDVNFSTPEMLFHENPYIVITTFQISGRFVAGGAAVPSLLPTP
jgi:hypothetical protein